MSAAIACVHRPPAVPAVPDGPRLVIMTYNVNFGLAGDAGAIDAIREGGADIVLLQETTEAWEAVLRDELAADYPHMQFRHCCRAGGLAILSRFELTGGHYAEATTGMFPAWRLVAHTMLGPIQVLNVHLRPPISDSGSVVSGYVSTRSVRVDEIAGFAALLEPGIPAVIAGDFNEERDGGALQYLRDRGYRDARPTPGAHTWRWHTSVGTLHADLDHIVHDDALVAVDTRVIRRGRSDHLPVVTTFAARVNPAPDRPR